ncbi:glycine-rich domain-containing protein [Leptothoe kymatousa]|uniref:Uncharacterized protein n=1 Tax=Leptothoe kymatousa TAU-MAC 1615 TaxID=2364775 RepID=A0ABS5Y4H1_9CYAN|nr:hypothetical protein [Leptothoe kymatousa]MBT9312725.1 hypothetical protein [Leptothoe kymatousa TAU-MAC 1615]
MRPQLKLVGFDSAPPTDFFSSNGFLHTPPLHHEPTLGSFEEKQKHKESYGRTLDSYQRFFGVEPPAQCWPTVEERFRQELHFVRVKVGQNWLLPYSLVSKGIVVIFSLLSVPLISGVYLVNADGAPNPTAVALMVFSLGILGYGTVQFVRGAISASKNRHRPSVPGCNGCAS